MIRKEIVTLSTSGAVAPFTNFTSWFNDVPSGLPLFMNLSRPMIRPSQIRSTGDEYLIEDEEYDQISRTDQDLIFSALIPIKKRKIGGNTQLEAIYDWSPLGQGILAFGDLKGVSHNEWESAFLYFDETGETQIFYRIGIEDPVRNNYLRNMPYITTIDNTGYILLFVDNTASIVELRVGTDGVRVLPFFPEGFRSRPRLDKLQDMPGPQKATAIYRLWEASTMPMALYAWEDRLYLLAKQAALDDDATTWLLIQLDRQQGKEIARTRLPTDASHLTVVPGEFWAFIEKGPVQANSGTQAPHMHTSSMILVPQSWLAEPNTKPLSTDWKLECTLFS